MDAQRDELCLIDDVENCVHGDMGYNRKHFLGIKFSGAILSAARRATNLAICGVRGRVDWMFEKVKLCWSISDFKRKMKTKESPVALFYLISMLLNNVRTCYCCENNVFQHFECDPLTVDQ